MTAPTGMDIVTKNRRASGISREGGMSQVAREPILGSTGVLVNLSNPAHAVIFQWCSHFYYFGSSEMFVFLAFPHLNVLRKKEHLMESPQKALVK